MGNLVVYSRVSLLPWIEKEEKPLQERFLETEKNTLQEYVIRRYSTDVFPFFLSLTPSDCLDNRKHLLIDDEQRDM